MSAERRGRLRVTVTLRAAESGPEWDEEELRRALARTVRSLGHASVWPLHSERGDPYAMLDFRHASVRVGRVAGTWHDIEPRTAVSQAFRKAER